MKMDLYYLSASSPCRAVLLTAKALGLEFNLKVVNILEGEQMKPEFLAINPQHTVPTLVDGDLTIGDSHAICTYLASQYGKDDSLYPKSPKARALVDRMLYFNQGTLMQRLIEYYAPVLFAGVEKPLTGKLDRLHEALGWFNGFLEGQNFAAGNQVTVADHCLVASVSSMDEAGIDLSKYSNILTWFNQCKTSMPGYNSENAPGAKIFGGLVKSKIH